MTNVRSFLAWTLTLLTFVLMLVPLYAQAECGSHGYIQDEYLIRYQDQNTNRFQKPVINLVENLGKNTKVIFSQSKILYTKSKNIDNRFKPANLLVANLEQTDINTLKSDSRILSIQKNCLIQLSTLPNDASFSSQWGIDLIRLQQAWNIEVGKESVVVAVIDSGVDYNHEDLKDNIWINFSELNGQDNYDDDGNGCVDDIYGCDFADNDGDPKPGFSDNAGHGTHVAGIVGAKGNNSIGIAGTAWNVKIMAIKGFSDFSKYAKLSDLLSGVYYAVTNGADIINASWGSASPPEQAEIDAFEYALSQGVLPVVAAGNNAIPAFQSTPAGIPGVFTVGSIGQGKQLSSFSNYGEAVNILAPGGDSAMSGGVDEYIFSTLPTNEGLYGPSRGTSMAAPFVAGVAALVKSTNHNLNPRDIMEILTLSSPKISVRDNDSSSTVVSYPLLDAYSALQLAQSWTPKNDNTCFGATCGQSIPGPVRTPTPQLDSPGFKQSGCSMVENTPAIHGSTNDIRAGYSLIFLLILIFSPVFILRRFKTRN